MTDHLFMTLLTEIVQYRKQYKIENTSDSARYEEYKKVIKVLATINYVDIDQFYFLNESLTCTLDNLYENADFANI